MSTFLMQITISSVFFTTISKVIWISTCSKCIELMLLTTCHAPNDVLVCTIRAIDYPYISPEHKFAISMVCKIWGLVCQTCSCSLSINDPSILKIRITCYFLQIGCLIRAKYRVIINKEKHSRSFTWRIMIREHTGCTSNTYRDCGWFSLLLLFSFMLLHQ